MVAGNGAQEEWPLWARLLCSARASRCSVQLAQQGCWYQDPGPDGMQ